MYKLYGLPFTRTFRTMWMLEEIGAEYELIQAAPHSPETSERNPSGKVPILETDEGRITDSTAILTYLGDRHDALTHKPGTFARARQDALTQLVLDEMDAVLWTAARHSFILPEERRCPEVKDSLKWEFERNTARLARQIDGPFLMGDRMTIPDIICLHCLNWARSAKFPLEHAALNDYAQGLRERPAFQRVAAMAK